jgi:hypothetical protein
MVVIMIMAIKITIIIILNDFLKLKVVIPYI